MKDTLEEWTKELNSLRKEHIWLVFFSMPKLLLLSKVLTILFQDERDFEEIVQEVSFLFCSDLDMQESIEMAVKVCQLDLDVLTVIVSFLNP